MRCDRPLVRTGVRAALLLGAALGQVACDPAYSVDVENSTASPLRFCVTESENCSSIEVPGGTTGNTGGVGTYQIILLSQESSGLVVSVRLNKRSHQQTRVTLKEADPGSEGSDTGESPSTGFRVVLSNAREDFAEMSVLTSKRERFSAKVDPGGEQTLRIGDGREIYSLFIRILDVAVAIDFEEGLHQSVHIKLLTKGTALPAPAPLDPRLCSFLSEGCPDE